MLLLNLQERVFLDFTKAKQSVTICFLSHSAGIAGAEKVFPKLLQGIQENGIKVHVLLPSTGPVIEELMQRNISYQIVPYSRWLNQDSNPLKRIKRTIKNVLMLFPIAYKIHKLKCDVVYSNTSTICVGAIAAKLLGLPHIWHFREFGSEDYGYRYDLGNKISKWLTNKLSTVCLVNSKAVREKYGTFIPDRKMKVIYEAYNKDFLDSKKNSDHIIDASIFNCTMVGTLHEAKGHIDAIKAIGVLLKLGKIIKLHIIGSGYEHYKNKLLKLINEMNISQNVEFLGYLDDPTFILKQSQVLLMCSRREAFGLVTLEALQSGIPVIGTRTGGTVELVKDGINGFLYSPGNFNELAEKIDILYNNRDKVNELGENGKTWANETFTFNKYLKETLKVINQLISIESN